MSNLAIQPSLGKLIAFLSQKCRDQIQNRTLVARIWIEGVGGICTLSFHPEIPTLSIFQDPESLPFDTSNMEIVLQEGYPTWIKIDMSNLALYDSIIIDPKEEFRGEPLLQNHMMDW